MPPHEFPARPLKPGYDWEVVLLFGGRARVQSTDGRGIGDFW